MMHHFAPLKVIGTRILVVYQTTHNSFFFPYNIRLHYFSSLYDCQGRNCLPATLLVGGGWNQESHRSQGILYHRFPSPSFHKNPLLPERKRVHLSTAILLVGRGKKGTHGLWGKVPLHPYTDMSLRALSSMRKSAHALTTGAHYPAPPY